MTKKIKMTNAEYFEKKNISFSRFMKLFNESKIKSFDEFLKSEHIDHKFKCGDIVVLQLNDYVRSYGWDRNVVFMINKCNSESYNVKFLTPAVFDGIIGYRRDIGYCTELPVEFIDENCKIY